MLLDASRLPEDADPSTLHVWMVLGEAEALPGCHGFISLLPTGLELPIELPTEMGVPLVQAPLLIGPFPDPVSSAWLGRVATAMALSRAANRWFLA